MPEVKLCTICKRRIDAEREDYVYGTSYGSVIHYKCYELKQQPEVQSQEVANA